MDPQERADHLRIFRRELGDLARADVLQLTPEQLQRVDQHIAQQLSELSTRHDVDTSEPEKQISLGMRIASALGGLALAIALGLFLNRYIGFWPSWLQVSVMAALPLALAAGSEVAARRERTLYYAALLALLALAAFVADLSILGILFNLTPTPNAFAVWGFFGVALAYHLGVRLVLGFGLTSLLGWVAATTNLWRGWWWLDFDKRPEDFMLAGLALALTPVVLRHVKHNDFPAVYRLVGLLAFFIAQLFLSAEGGSSYLSSYLAWASKPVEHFYQLAGVITSGAAVWIGIRNHWTGTINIATAFFTIFLFVRLVDWWWDWMPKYLFFLLIGAVALGLVAAFKRMRAGFRTAS